MNTSGYKYDVAISFATEDAEIANQIGRALKDRNILFYLYTEENNVGQNIKKETWKVYTKKSLFTLALLSKHYVVKRFATEEWEAILTVHRPEDVPYIIPLRLDSTAVDGLHPNTVFLKWSNNPEEIAQKIHEMILMYSPKITKKKKKKAQKSNSKGGKMEVNKSNITNNKVKGTIIGIDKSSGKKG